ncbi:Eukaryotic translation initiation factor 3 subunit D [Homalodisca vitripennis]|nr:Eukaryotic translation initiation factor 3 subunit D [Homalodisca vitripennis]
MGMRNQKNQPPIKNRDASVTVRPDWVTIEEMDFPRLAKLSLPNVKDGEDIVCCGSLEYYDKAYDRVNVKSEKPLQRIDRIFHTVTTTDDPIIRKEETWSPLIEQTEGQALKLK